MERRAGPQDGSKIGARGAGVRRLAARPQSQQQPAVGSELADGVVAIIGTEDSAIGPNEDTVWPREQTFAPCCQPSAVAVKHQHRMGAAVENVDTILRIGGNSGD